MAINVYIAEDNESQRISLEQAIKNYQLFSDWELTLAYSTSSGGIIRKYRSQESVEYLLFRY